MGYKILAVDDESGIRRLLKDYFQMQDYQVYTAASGEEALGCLKINPDIILLDVNMPGMDGFELCEKIRDSVTCPILFLTARIQENDKVQGLLRGGDDYILKPFSLEELNARVIAHLRREERKNQMDTAKFADDFMISYAERQVSIKQQIIELTKTEFDIVELLSRHKGQIFGRERIYEEIRGYDGEGDSSIMTEHIRRIRLKLSLYSEKNHIETVWGVGYKWIG